MRILTRAPSNIAMIKYMGKKDAASNLPENGSLSLTLDGLCTYVELEASDSEAPASRWVPELPSGAAAGAKVPSLDESGTAKVLRHVERVRRASEEILPAFGLEADARRTRGGSFALRSANTFPEASGIASSASAFAAVTLAAAAACARDTAAFGKAYDSDPGLRRALAKVSRQGSGSSCRSFEGPWVGWEGEDAAAVEARMPALAHFVLIVSDRPKKVSSSQAHLLIKTSPLWSGRIERVEKRLIDLRSALVRGDLAQVSRIAWQEAWEMHSLFHTCSEPFSYWEPGSLRALNALAAKMGRPGAPIVTMDAGPNVHLSVEASRAEQWRAALRSEFPDVRILEDRPGRGAELLPEASG